MIDERYKDADNLNEQNVGDRLKIFDRIIKIRSSGKSFGVCVKVFQEKQPKRDNTGKLM
jgi:hypothetical protein